jgi:hypothetical protein
MRDRVGADSFPLTQELLGVMLGARRQSVNAVARNLKRGRVVDYRHGTKVVRNRAKLEEVACDCYGIVRDQFASIGARTNDRRYTEATAAPLCPCCGAHDVPDVKTRSVRQQTDHHRVRMAQRSGTRAASRCDRAGWCTYVPVHLNPSPGVNRL